MKTTRYRFEQAVQDVKVDNIEWLRDEFKAILESDKDFSRKADYIGLSIASIDNKIVSIDEEIKELQELKRRLKSAKETTLKLGAEVFASYGIEKIEGAAISSITTTKKTSKVKSTLKVVNQAPLIAAGYIKMILDEDAVMKALLDPNTKGSLQDYCYIENKTIVTDAKLKINKRRSTTNHLEPVLKHIA